MIKRAMIAGLNSTGVDVADLRVLPGAVGRHLLKTHGYDAGFHVGVSPTDPEVVQIRFFEQPGIQMTPALQKEVEKHFTRQELRRVGRRRDRRASLPGPRARELRAGSPRDARRRRDPRARVPDRRRLRLLGALVRAAAPARAARGRGGDRARVRDGPTTPDRGVAARVDRPGEAARRARSARDLGAVFDRAGGAALPRRRAGARDRRSSGRCCSSCA